MSTSRGFSSVRSHSEAPASRAAMVVMSSNWSQLGRPRNAVPSALMCTAGWSRSGAKSRCDTMTTVEPSQGASQSYRHSGVGDHPRREIVLHRHRVAIDGLGVQARIGPVVDGDGAHLLAGQPELVHAALGHHGQPVAGRDGAVGDGPLQEAAEAGDRAAAPTAAAHALAPAGALGRALGHRAVDEHVLGQPGRHGQRGGVHGPHLRRPLAAAVVPVEREAERVLHLGRRGPAEAGGPAPMAG